jgi:hypothetical protein
MKVIYKYQLKPMVLLPKEALVLKAGIQNGELFVWALVDPNETTHIERLFEIVGTGHSFEHGYLTHRHVDTIFDGPFVWHIWEVNKN